MDILMEVITVNLVEKVFNQVFIGLIGHPTEAKIVTQGSNPCPSAILRNSLRANLLCGVALSMQALITLSYNERA